MGVQRQVVGQQTDIGLQQTSNPLPFHAADARIFAAPEITVVDQYGVGFPFDGRVNQGQRCGDPADQFAHRLPAFDLQAVRAIILEIFGLQQSVGLSHQQRKRNAHTYDSP